MRVLQVIPSISPLNGGPSAAVHALSRALARQGLQVDVATSDDHGPHHLTVPYGKPLERDGVRFFFFYRQIKFYTVCWGLSFWLLRYGGDYDVYHIHGLFSFSSIVAAIVARVRRIPYVLQPHGSLGIWGFANRRSWLKRLSFRLLEHPLIRAAASLYLNTDSETEEALEIGISRAADVVPYAMTLPNVDRAAFARRFLEAYPQFQSGPILLFLSRVDPKKGLDVLLDAFRKVHDADAIVNLVIVGSGDPQYVAELKDRAARLQISESVHFIGFLSGEMKWAAYAAADLFVLPTYSENFGMVVVEAMSTGTPVVVTRGAAVSVFVQKEGGGVTTECSSQSIGDAIIRLLANPATLRQLGEEASIAAKLYSADAVALQTADLYRRLATPPLAVGGRVRDDLVRPS